MYVSHAEQAVTCTTDETKLWLSPSAKQRKNPCSWSPPVFQHLSTGTRHDWPVKKAIVDLPIRMKGNSKRTSSNSLSPLAAQNKMKNLSAALQMILTEVKLHLQHRLIMQGMQRNVPKSGTQEQSCCFICLLNLLALPSPGLRFLRGL